MRRVLIIAAALAVAVAPAASLADPGHGKGGSKRHPHGIPPGQAKKYWSKGERLPPVYVSERRYYVTEPWRYDLGPAPYGYRYVLVDDRIYLAQTSTGLILDVISALLR
jgi:Ni/Co efflux regulator RcnB